MIDFIKILITDNTQIEHFKSHSLLTWFSKNEKLSHFDYETVYSKEVKIFKGILFCFYENKLEILFKPHYYFNDNLHNANDFNSIDCIKVMNDFINTFNIKEPQDFKIINIEYGINIAIPYDIKDFITYLSYHSKNLLTNDDSLAFSKKGYKANKNGSVNFHKVIKLYAKCLQFPTYCDKNTFRFEVKSKKSAYIKTLSIETIKDLIELKTYEILAENIVKEWDNVLILGLVDESVFLDTKENNLLSKYQNPNYWYKIKQNHRNQFNNTKKVYFKLLDKTEQNPHTKIRELLIKKLEKTCAVFQPLNKKITCANLPINIMENCTFIENRFCLVTGVNIYMQKDNSILLSHSGLKYYYKNDKTKFDDLKQKYLSNRWRNSDIETQIKEIAHNIRNTNSNQKIKQNRLYPKEQLNINFNFL